MADEDEKIKNQTAKQLEAFARSLGIQVREDLQDRREFKADKEAKIKAREQAELREKQESLRKEQEEKEKHKREKEEERRAEVTKEIPKDDDSDLEDFIDTDPWESAKNNSESSPKSKQKDASIGKRDSSESSPPIKRQDKQEESTAAPAIKIKQTKLKPKQK